MIPIENGVQPRSRRGLQPVTGAAYPDWDSVYRDNVTWVYRLMYRKVGNQPDAEDLTAEVFMTALRPMRISATIPEVRAYLHTTARTVLAAYWRDRMGRQITSIDEDVPESSEPEQVVGDAPETVRRLLQRLPDNYRRILELRFLQAASVREAASHMGVSVANAKVLQHRALRMAAQNSGEAAR
ncbi:RNA polymerase sigma factor, sigma-70 family [Mycolicibacterium rhodesiae NBB3]|uniref:RNA polymerase sigma factor, sigma-70 family n=1 Tax=Mycolicibacterium rhodesiae (strain NBB3) TaxID=710685 RepID=G8RPM5_MYCRN|nr:RNA polymerase sigma factor, sigma-70 family [Mycolicibacterium rhodesiae NBB3]